MGTKSFTTLFKEARIKDSFWAETAILEFTSELYAAMEKRGHTKADLARALGTSQAYITKVFRGDANFTIDSMVRLTRALGYRLHIHIAQPEENVNWGEFALPKKMTNINDWQLADNYKKVEKPNRNGITTYDLASAA
jgi:transcriptional regulator with XRE-family HTH domain